MRISRFILALCVIGATTTTASAGGDTYVCSVTLDTGFSKDSEVSLPGSRSVRIKANLHSQPYCQGGKAKDIWLSSPTLDETRRDKKAVLHTGLVRNSLQGVLSSFMVFEIAAAQGIAFTSPIVVQTEVDVTEPKLHDYGFQSSRPASVKVEPKVARVGILGQDTVAGYPCLSRHSFKIGDAHEIPTANDIHRFKVRLYSQPYCRGKQIFQREYEVGPAMGERLRRTRKIRKSLDAMAMRVNAAAIMQSVYVALVEAGAAGQRIIITHTREHGLISSITFEARPRDLANEVKTIAPPKGN